MGGKSRFTGPQPNPQGGLYKMADIVGKRPNRHAREYIS